VVVDSEAEVSALRSALKSAIWPSGGYPTNRAADSTASYTPDYWLQPQPNLATIPNLAGITQLTVNQYLGVNVRPIHFKPTTKRDRGIIFAQGHDSGPWYPMPRNIVYRLLVQGFDVVTVAMPLLFMEDRPAIPGLDSPSHDDMGDFQTGSFNPLSWFLEPSIAALNHLLAVSPSLTDVSMMGYSGGGWATALLAALDTRITHSYPIVGWLPLSLREGNEFGDWEQYQADIWDAPFTHDYEDLAVMAADSAGRTQIQILGDHDPIFPDNGRSASYAATVSAAAAGLGGTWDVLVDSLLTEHAISDAALNAVLEDMGVTIW
jgi:hypothetical protein